MQKLSYIAAIVLIITIFTSFPVIAQDNSRFSHTIDFKIGGAITINREIGHACTTGAVKRQTVRGFGEMTRHENIRIANNIMSVNEVTDWTVPANALSGLTMITIIELCHRPMTSAAKVYKFNATDELKIGDILTPYHPLVVDGTIVVSALTSQIWATAIETNPGHIGSHHSNFVAAYGPGPYEAIHGAVDPFGNPFFYDSEYMWEFDTNVNFSNRDDLNEGYKRGKYYVGNYFSIDQYAYTSEGYLKRYISISSPFENSILIEDLSVLGMASVRESFNMHNLKGGPKAVKLAWYELF